MSSSEVRAPDAFARCLQALADEDPSRGILVDIVDELITAVGAERGFWFRPRDTGGFHVVVARHQDREDVPEAAERMSHYAVGRMLAAGDFWTVVDARQDRRYRTEDVREGRRPPRSIQIYPVRVADSIVGGIYVDHRFRELPEELVSSPEVGRWTALASMAWSLRELRAQLRSLERRIAGRDARSSGTAAGGDAVSSRAPAPRIDVERDPESLVTFHGLLSSNPDMLDLFDAVRRLASSDIAVLIHGETGTGKGLLARALHLESRRKEGPFVTLTCGSVPDSLFDSELLGHVKGAFTGAETDRTGLLEEASGGTLFIDEPGDLALETQTKLLRVLADGRVRPLGGKKAIDVDVRIVAATSRSLDTLVSRGEFRDDLYYRLRGSELFVPPLRERWEDVPGLVDHLQRKHGARELSSRVGVEVLERLSRYAWPGNVRELENEICRLCAYQLEEVTLEHLAPIFKGQRGLSSVFSRDVEPLDVVVARAEREALERALRVSGGNKSQAAELLGITRKALYRRIAKHEIGTTIEPMSEGLDRDRAAARDLDEHPTSPDQDDA